MAIADNRSTPWTFVLDEPTRILVVDDDPILREFASVYLGTPFTTIDTACDGAAARTRLAEASYDIAILDIEMPRLDGLSLLTEIRSSETLRLLPVIMLTGHDDITSIDRAYHIGANSFASKPVNWRQLSYQIRYVLRTSRLEGLYNFAGSGTAVSEHQVLAPATENVREFLQNVVQRANSIEESLSVLERPRWAEPLQNLRLFALQALAECSGRVPMTTSDGGRPTASVACTSPG